MKVWTYAIATDVGGAPNFEGPAATLAICKPPIRRAAAIGDLVLASNGREASLAPETRWEPNSVRWAGVVSDTLGFAEYWNDPRFTGKRPGHARMPDNIYQPVDGVLIQVPNHVHEARHVSNDVRGEKVLVFARAWYFGDTAPVLPGSLGFWMPVRARIGQRSTIVPDDTVAAVLEWLDAQLQAAPNVAIGKSCGSVKPILRSCAVRGTC